jgi:hypothetical protein
MSRSRRALAALTMAAAVGGALLTAGCGAGPADAANPQPPANPGGPLTRGQSQSVTASLKDGVRRDDDHPFSITCTLFVNPPFKDDNRIRANADVACDSDVAHIDAREQLAAIDHTVDTAQDSGRAGTHTATSTECVPGVYTNNANATITFPSDYQVTRGSTSLSLTVGTSGVGRCDS